LVSYPLVSTHNKGYLFMHTLTSIWTILTFDFFKWTLHITEHLICNSVCRKLVLPCIIPLVLFIVQAEVLLTCIIPLVLFIVQAEVLLPCIIPLVLFI